MWVTIALDRETRVAIDLDRFEDGGGAPAEGRISKFRRGRAIGKQRPASGRLPVLRLHDSHDGVRRALARRVSGSPASMADCGWTERP